MLLSAAMVFGGSYLTATSADASRPAVVSLLLWLIGGGLALYVVVNAIKVRPPGWVWLCLVLIGLGLTLSLLWGLIHMMFQDLGWRRRS